MKRFISLALAVLMIFSLCITASADSEQSNAQGSFYYAIGDSISLRVDGTPAVNEYAPNRGGCEGSRWVKDSYIDRIYDQYGFTGGYLCGHTGWRLEEAICALDETWVVDDYSLEFYPAWAGGDINKVISERQQNIENLKKADLVTLQIGSNGILGTLNYDTTKELEKLTAYSPCKDRVLKAIAEAKAASSPEETFYLLLETAESIGKITVIAESIIADIAEFTFEYGQLWDRLIGLVRKYNPTAKIAVIGMYNPTDSFLTVQQGMDEVIGKIAKIITEPYLQSLNTYVHYISRYSKDYAFIDASNADHYNGSLDGAHLGAKGHAQVAQKFFSVMGNTFTPPCRHTHTHVEKAKAATKLTLGYSGNVVCSDCGKTLSTGNILFYKFKIVLF